MEKNVGQVAPSPDTSTLTGWRGSLDDQCVRQKTAGKWGQLLLGWESKITLQPGLKSLTSTGNVKITQLPLEEWILFEQGFWMGLQFTSDTIPVIHSNVYMLLCDDLFSVVRDFELSFSRYRILNVAATYHFLLLFELLRTVTVWGKKLLQSLLAEVLCSPFILKSYGQRTSGCHKRQWCRCSQWTQCRCSLERGEAYCQRRKWRRSCVFLESAVTCEIRKVTLSICNPELRPDDPLWCIDSH